jgi:hypothetical protein
MSGRISALAATKEPSGKITVFVGAASGGVWKSDDGGTRYRPVFDEQPVQSIGAIALDPKILKCLGRHCNLTRNSVSIGNNSNHRRGRPGTWFGKVNGSRRVSPKNPDRFCCCTVL